MAKILVVGGAGYVGSVLVEELLERGYEVRVLDRLYFGKDGLKRVLGKVDLVVGDMRTVGREVLASVDAVINVGGLSNDPTAEYNPTANYEMNTVATQTLAEFCKSQGVERYIFASSCSVYDRGLGEDVRDELQDEDSADAPTAVYSRSKYEAERRLLAMADDEFCPVVLRKGTIFGFSARMRYDLVVNTFVKDALSKGLLTIFHGGEMWRPLVDIRDVSRAYVACLEADPDKVRGEIFNVSSVNVRISELALRVREVLSSLGVHVDIHADYQVRTIRSYRVVAQKITRVLGFEPSIVLEQSVEDIVAKIRENGYLDFENPKYFNIDWMRMLESAHSIIGVTGSVFGIEAES